MRRLPARVLTDFLAHGCATHSAALAFYALFVLVPIPIFVVSGAAVLVGDELARTELLDLLHTLAGAQVAATLSQALENVSVLGGEGTRFFALVSMVFGATAFFVELQDTLNKIWDAPLASFEWRRFALSRLVSFVMVAAAGSALLLLTLGGAVVRGFGERLSLMLPVAAPAFGVGGMLVSLLVVWALFCLVFRHIPDAEVTFPEIWLGSFATAVMFMGGNEIIGLYLRSAGIATVYGAAGSLVVTLLWIYYSALAFLMGAELTRALGERRRPDSPKT